MFDKAFLYESLSLVLYIVERFKSINAISLDTVDKYLNFNF